MDECERLERDADDLRGQAAGAMSAGRRGVAERLVRRAWRLYRDAARLASGPDRSRLMLVAASAAEAVEDHRAVAAIVREAVRGEPDYETVEALREYWDCSAWVLTRAGGPAPFPEPAPLQSRTLLDRKAPLPGQGVLFDDAKGG